MAAPHATMMMAALPVAPPPIAAPPPAAAAAAGGVAMDLNPVLVGGVGGVGVVSPVPVGVDGGDAVIVSDDASPPAASRGHYNSVNDYQRECIIRMHLAGHSNNSIAFALAIKHDTISTIVLRWKKTGIYLRKKKGGNKRKHVLSDLDRETIARIHSEHSSWTLRQVRDAALAETEHAQSFSISTIARAIKMEELKTKKTRATTSTSTTTTTMMRPNKRIKTETTTPIAAAAAAAATAAAAAAAAAATPIPMPFEQYQSMMNPNFNPMMMPMPVDMPNLPVALSATQPIPLSMPIPMPLPPPIQTALSPLVAATQQDRTAMAAPDTTTPTTAVVQSLQQ